MIDTRSRGPRRLAAAVTIVALLAACSGDDDDDTSGTDAVSFTPVATSGPTGTQAPPAITDAVSSTDATTTPTTSATTTSTNAGGKPSDYPADQGPSDVPTYMKKVLGVTFDPACDVPFVPGEVLVYISAAARAEITRDELWTEIRSALNETELLVDVEAPNQLVPGNDNSIVTTAAGPVYRIELDAGAPPAIAAVNNANSILDGAFEGEVVLAVDHIAPFLPNGLFHPFDNPEPVEVEDDSAPTSGEGQHTVLVIDSPTGDDYDEWSESWEPGTTDQYNAGYHGANQHVDFVAGHGDFVSDIIERYAPNAQITSSGVTSLDTDWPPFLFSDSDLIRALDNGLAGTDPGPGDLDTDTFLPPTRHFAATYDIINMSLGTFGCPGAHRVLGRVLDEVLQPALYDIDVPTWEDDGSTATAIVAAVGNDGEDEELKDDRHTASPHYPAGFTEDGGVLGRHVIAVGALAEMVVGSFADSSPDHYTNDSCVDVWGLGRTRAMFPWSTPTLTEWSGTSFAAARVSGVLAGSVEPVEDWATTVDTSDTTVRGACPT